MLRDTIESIKFKNLAEVANDVIKEGLKFVHSVSLLIF